MWVDFPVELTETIFVKQGAIDLSLTIPNFSEIKEYLERTEPCLVGHEWMKRSGVDTNRTGTNDYVCGTGEKARLTFPESITH
jgi:hypothetical protein